MKAIIINKFGSVNELQMAQVPVPEVGPNQVLVKNYYTTVNPMDCKVRAGQFKLFAGRKFPKVFGSESAGVIEQVGKNVAGLKKGDRVTVNTGFKFGTYAEFVSVDKKAVFKLPDAVDFAQGACLPCAGGTAHNGLCLTAKVKPGDEVLINGAYGGIGSFAVQLAKLAGAKVTGICSKENLENVKALHADQVFDYTRQDVYGMGKQFDIVFDTVGKLDIGKIQRLVKKGGILVTTVGSFRIMLAMLFNLFRSKKVKSVWNNPSTEDMNQLMTLIIEHKLKVIIDREYPLEEVAVAHQYSETGRAKGKILVSILNS
ncbi:NAD(P)-dependent alcohol dehydrogenase [Mucilaginibacter flavus]|uniref:NAD(P)-dependent alcohol dehydrogenase n=1 Tax=Mucilaginibacter flavus TaxID=931504 RepID=UPI0025B3F002|nr:NAD(P)-dependent alcohol dehydrogenase [Mucilaginibacter flavus]MDN3584612.1 NAD(P)-dependent alcohol dehydrogenase [Mucilaginibacter flavus]